MFQHYDLSTTKLFVTPHIIISIQKNNSDPSITGSTNDDNIIPVFIEIKIIAKLEYDFFITKYKKFLMYRNVANKKGNKGSNPAIRAISSHRL